MRRILLVLSTSRYSRGLVDEALREAEDARAGGTEVGISILYVVEVGELQKVYRSVGEEGFLGLGPQKQVLDTLAAEHHRMARRRIREATEEATRRGFPVDVSEVNGDYAEAVHATVSDQPFDVIYVTRADRPFISRFLFGSECDRVARLVRRDGLGEVVID